MLIGRLCPGDSFGETTVLKGLPMPCSAITDTNVQIGTISTLDVYGTFPSVLYILANFYHLCFFSITPKLLNLTFNYPEEKTEAKGITGKMCECLDFVACVHVASVSVVFYERLRQFSLFGCTKIGTRANKWEEGVPSSQFSRGQKGKNNLLKRTAKPTETFATQARGLENMEGRRNLVKASCAA